VAILERSTLKKGFKVSSALLKEITRQVALLCQESNYGIREDVYNSLYRAAGEESGLSRKMLDILLENIKIAQRERIPVCQDTGICEVFLQIGRGVEIEGDKLSEAVEQGVREGYRDGYLRKSIVSDPLFSRKNTGDNTPALIYFDFELPFPNRIKITVFPRGFGAENMGKITMLSPAEGEEGLKKFVVRTVSEAGANPCPPVVVGVGIGGTLEMSARLAQKALLRPINQSNEDPRYAQLEGELLEKINELRIGPQGLGGKVTCLGVNAEYFPTHMAGLPVCVNINCYALRQASSVVEID